MQAVYAAIVAGVTGVTAGVAAVTLTAGKESPVPVVCHDGELAGLTDRLDRTESLLRELRAGLAAGGHEQPLPTAANAAQQMDAQAQAAGVSDSQTRQEQPVADMAVEAAIVDNIIVRLYDPAYVRSTSLAGIMNSEEMLGLSEPSRERVVAQMVGMMNRGEIDASAFMSGQSQ